jgi:hypothetical protein
MDIKSRDVVRQISGGPLMVDDEVVVDQEAIWCSWREEGDRQIRRERFSPAALKKVGRPRCAGNAPANGRPSLTTQTD